MRWPFFLVMVYLFVGLQTSLAPLMRIDHIAPSLLMILAVYVALHTSSMTLGYACLLIGLLVDLTTVVPLADGVSDTAIIGPNIVGYVFGGWVVLQLRNLVYRDSPIGIALVVFVAGVFIHLIGTALLTFRGLPWLTGQPIPNWSAADELVRRFFQLLYTAALSVPLGYLLAKLYPVFRFEPQTSKSYVKR